MNGKDLVARGWKPGPLVGDLLKIAKHYESESDFLAICDDVLSCPEKHLENGPLGEVAKKLQRERTRERLKIEVPTMVKFPVLTSGTGDQPSLIDKKITVFGVADDRTINQIRTCINCEEGVAAVLCADNHLGYSQPIGGVTAYRGYISPSGVGFDIGCGNQAVRTNLKYEDIRGEISRLADEIQSRISFGLGRRNQEKVDDPIFADPRWTDISVISHLRGLANNQLGTVGSGNHFVDVLLEEGTGDIWVANHFGSRGFGHKTASGFLNLAAGRAFDDKTPGESMDTPPTLIKLDSPLGQDYLGAMQLAGDYAYAGRKYVTRGVLKILGAEETFSVHNNHNLAWIEQHFGEELCVVRKGATPCFPDQYGFIGGSMCDMSVIVRGVDTEKSRKALYSTVHGAGRIMSRTQAAGKMNYRTRKRCGGQITPEMLRERVKEYGIALRGGGCDESPFVYKQLRDVLMAHRGTMEIVHTLKPIIVVMAREGEEDYKAD